MSRQQTPNRDLAADTARYNLLVNGNMNIAQRGSGPWTANNAYTIDRWQISLGGTSTMALQWSNAIGAGPGGANVCGVGNASYVQGSADSYWGQTIKLAADGVNLGLRGQIISGGIKVSANAASAVRLHIVTDGTSAINTFSNFHPSGGAYSTLKVENVLVPIDATFIRFELYFSASCSLWAAAQAILNLGAVASDYIPLHPADDLARCKRYYELFAPGVGLIMMQGQAISATQALFFMPYMTEKAVVPTVTLSPTPAHYNSLNASGSGLACSTAGASDITKTSFRVNTTVASGLTAGQSSFFTAANAAGTIVVEANP